MTYVKSDLLTLAAVEKLTGLSREVLRKWAQRYQFPQPLRGKRGERLFAPGDALRLQLQARLIGCGLRAGSVVPLDTAQLQTLLAAQPNQALPRPEPAALARQVQALLALLAPQAGASALAPWLEDTLGQTGLGIFAAHVMPAFNRAVGDAWQAGTLAIHAEHHYTETLRQVVTRAMPHTGHSAATPRVLLTTPPQELHSLGLLALQSQLRLAGADVISLGTQTPAADVLAAVRSCRVGVLAISLSSHLPTALAADYLTAIDAGLPADCALWLGGAGCAGLPADTLRRGCEVFADTQSAVQRWQQLAWSSAGLKPRAAV